MLRKITLLIVSFILVAFQLSAQITAHFTTSDTSGCSPSLSFVYFIDSSHGGNRSAYTYKWVVTNSVSGVLATAGFAPTLSTYNYTFSSTGIYSVTEVVTDGVDTSRFTQRIFVSPMPVVNFTTTPTAVAGYTLCPPLRVNFINTSADTSACHNNGWLWNITDPTHGFHVSLTGSSASYTFTQQGTYNVQLTLTSCCGSQSITKNALINIGATPAGSFTTASTGSACHLPATINFINSTTGASTYLWKFGNGGTSTLPNPSHTYTDNAIYTDTLIAYNSTGCPDTVIHYGDVHIPVLHSGFTATNPVCLGNSLNCTDTTTGWVGNKWILIPVAPATYSNSSANNTAVSFLIPATGTYIVYDSTVGSSCWNVHRDSIKVVGLPTVSVSGSNLYRCSSPDTAHFFATVRDAVSIDHWLWTFGDVRSGTSDTSSTTSTAQHIYRLSAYSPYTDTLSVIDHNGCSASKILTNFVNIQAPHATLATSADSGCVPLSFTYSLTSVTPSEPYTIDSVTYGDGSAPCLGAGCLPGIHIYNDTGHFKLHVYYHMPDSLGGCNFSDSTRTIHVGNYQPDFHITMSSDSVCPNTLVWLNDGCTNCTGRRWSIYRGTGRFNGKTDSTYAQITHLVIPGVDSIKWFGSVNGCFASKDTFVWVFNPAAVVTASTPSCNNRRTVTFNAAGSTGATGFFWNFGDGSTHHSGNLVTHTYASAGVYSVIMVDSANNATNHFCRNRDTTVVNVFPIIDTFHIKNLYPCINATDSFTAARMKPDSAKYAKYIWKWGDGTTNTITSSYKAAHSYANAGIYWDTLIIKSVISTTDIIGCYDTIPAAIPVSVGPQMRLVSNATVCADAASPIIDSSFDFSNAVIKSRQWSIPALGTIYNSKGMDTNFTLPEGTYNVCLIDSDNHNCSNQACINVTAVRPHAYFYSPDSNLHVCSGIAIPFVDTNSNCSYIWQFGDGATTTSSAPSVTHVFSHDGTYSNSVIVISQAGGQYPAGCTDTFTFNNEFTLSNINVGFSISPAVHVVTCPPLTGATFNTTTPFNDYTYWWKSTSTATSGYPAVSFDAADQFSMNYLDTLPGIYTITLLDSNSIGCKDSVSDTFYIGGPSGYVSLSTSDTGCIPFHTAMTFHDTGTSAINQYVWLVNGAFSTNILTVSDSLTFNNTGVYDSFHLVLTSGTGDSACTVNYLLPFKINVFTSPTITVTYPQHICSQLDAAITASGADSYFWSPAAGLSSTNGAQVLAKIDSTTTYQLTSISHGCIQTQDVTLTLDSIPQPPVFGVISDKMLCAGTNYQNFGALTAPATNTAYSWSALNAQIYETGQSGQYALVNFDSAGVATIIIAANYAGSICKSYDSVTVNVGNGQVPVGTVAQTDNQFIYLNNQVTFYQWGYDNEALDSAALPNGTYQNYYCVSPDYAGKHYWVMAANDGCIQKTFFTPQNDTAASRTQSETYMDTYPNPSGNYVNITVHSPNTSATRVDIEDINGRVLKSVYPDNLKLQIDLSDLQQGVYIINCYQNGAKIAATHLVKE